MSCHTTKQTTEDNVQLRSTQIHAADTTQATTTDTTKNHQTKTTIRNTSALPNISEDGYNFILIVCACVMLMAIVRICKI